ncbi:MAG: hypothetical protein ACRD19_16405 [Terriglobia bacterium]
MNGLRHYSSITAFLTHYRARACASADGAIVMDERDYLDQMERLIESALNESERDDLGRAENEAITNPGQIADPRAMRRRARAELKLHRALAQRRVLIG